MAKHWWEVLACNFILIYYLHSHWRDLIEYTTKEQHLLEFHFIVHPPSHCLDIILSRRQNKTSLTTQLKCYLNRSRYINRLVIQKQLLSRRVIDKSHLITKAHSTITFI